MARLEFASAEAVSEAAHGGSVDALFELGISYSTGRDVDVDLVLAHKYFNLAAQRGNDDARRYRMELSREMSREQVAEAQRMAREWMRRH